MPKRKKITIIVSLVVLSVLIALYILAGFTIKAVCSNPSESVGENVAKLERAAKNEDMKLLARAQLYCVLKKPNEAIALLNHHAKDYSKEPQFHFLYFKSLLILKDFTEVSKYYLLHKPEIDEYLEKSPVYYGAFILEEYALPPMADSSKVYDSPFFVLTWAFNLLKMDRRIETKANREDIKQGYCILYQKHDSLPKIISDFYKRRLSELESGKYSLKYSSSPAIKDFIRQTLKLGDSELAKYLKD